MPKISLTDFVDIVSKAGTPKVTKVKEVKNRSEYSPAADFYKKVRECIVDAHQRSLPKAELAKLLAAITDARKLTHYPDVVRAYTKWWGHKNLVWFPPPNAVFSGHNIDVSVNPELGLRINGKPHIIKLYFKGEPLSKNRIDIVTHLMEVRFRPGCANKEVMAVLDIRNGRLISPTVPIPLLDAALDAELAYIAALWPGV
jgi:hypothetical protein